MSIINDLSNHADTIRQGLSTLSLRTPDRVQQILDTRARYKTGVAGTGFSLTYLQDTPNVMFYRGADRLEAQEADPTTTQIIVPWTNLMAPVQFTGTELEETRGLRSDRMTDENYSLSDMGTDDRLVFIDYVMSRTAATASRIQNARVQTLWGKDAGLATVSADRKPLSLPGLFDDSTGLYGEPVDALGKFESGHPWAEDNAFGASKAYKMAPRVYYFNDASTTTRGSNRTLPNPLSLSDPAKTTGTDGEQLTPDQKFQRLYEIISEFAQVVQGTKLAICDNSVFSKIAFEFKDSDRYPMLVGTDQWRFTIRCVQMEDTYFISDPNKSRDDNSIEVLHIGDQDGSGTIFPFYWDPGMSVSDSMQRQNEYMMMDVPDGMAFGPRRDIPFYIDKFSRFDGMADAIGTNERLKYMNVCTEPWCQLQIRQISA